MVVVSREKTASLEKASPRQKQSIVNAFAGAVVQNGGSINQIAEQTGLPRKTVKVIKKDPERYVSSLTPSELSSLQDRLAGKLMQVADSITDRLPDKIDSASLKDSAVALGVILDKSRLILGLSTGRTESVNMTLHKIVQSSNSAHQCADVLDAEVKGVEGGAPPKVSNGEE